MKFVPLLVAAAIPLLIATASQAQPIILNGFMNGTAPGINNWTRVGAVEGTGLTALFLGLNANNFPGGGAGNLSQTVTGLTATYMYQVTFDLDRSNRPGTPPSFYDFTAQAAGSSFSMGGITSSPPNNTPFLGSSFIFTAGSSTELLSFFTTGLNTKDFILDNVSIQTVPGPLPLLGVAAAFGWTRKLRRRIKASEGQAATV